MSEGFWWLVGSPDMMVEAGSARRGLCRSGAVWRDVRCLRFVVGFGPDVKHGNSFA